VPVGGGWDEVLQSVSSLLPLRGLAPRDTKVTAQISFLVSILLLLQYPGTPQKGR
jgi:hypothetical protein